MASSNALWRALAIGVAIASVAVVLAVITLNAPPGPVFTNTARGYRVTYPDGWNTTLSSNGTLTLRSFAPQATLPGGNPPKGGVLIVVQAFPPYTNRLFPEGSDDDAAMDQLAEGDGKEVVSRVTASSGEPARLAYIESLAKLHFVLTIRHKEGKTFLFTLVYRTDDPDGAAREHTFDDLIASVSVTEGAPASPTP
jgi:hypothetical protein